MKRYILILLLFLSSEITAYSQNREIIKEKIKDTQLHDEDFLSWIKTGKDIVNQDQLTEKEIDEKIDNIIKSQASKAVADIETPINFKKLRYYGYSDIRKLSVISDNNIFKEFPNFYGEADSAKNIYQYGNLIIQCTFNSYEDQLHVYSIIRAFLIIKNKYPEIYSVLFNRTESVQFGKDINKDIDPSRQIYLNSNKNYIVTIHENDAKKLSATTTNYGTDYKINSKVINNGNFRISDNNNHFIFLNKGTIRNGGTAIGSKDIYNDPTLVDRELHFLFDGLLQTLVHERMHNYIGNYQGVDNYLNFIRNDATLLNGGNTYDLIEEPIVTNTTNQIFQKLGGISKEIMEYYSDLFNKSQLPNIKALPQYDALITKLNTLSSNKDASKNLLLNIFYWRTQQRQQTQLPPGVLQKKQTESQTIQQPKPKHK